MVRKDGFEQREQATTFGYWEDNRWEEVKRLRSEDKNAEANSLTFEIRDNWGID